MSMSSSSITWSIRPRIEALALADLCRTLMVKNCPSAMTEQRTEDQGDKQEKRRERALAGVFEREGIKHRNPRRDRDGSGIAGAPGLVGTGQHTEGAMPR